MSLPEHCIIPDWPAPARVNALQTTRQGGVSIAPYDSLNLGSHVGDNPLSVARNRVLLSALLPAEPVWLEQVHGVAVANADAAKCLAQDCPDETTSHSTRLSKDDSQVAGYDPGRRADACIARQCEAVCAVMTADCLPVLLCDMRGSVVGAVHAGWKGMAAGVIEATVQAMEVAPQHLMAWLGPAISQEVFEVGEEVRAAFVAVQPQAAAAFMPGQSGKWFADIYALARLRLNALGVTQIYGDDYCTFRERGRFFSYRRDGVTGRMGTFIWLA